MVKKLSPLIIIAILSSGCTSRDLSHHLGRIAVAESFMFVTIERNSGHRRAFPPARQTPAGGGVVLPAPCPLPTGRHFKIEKKNKGLFRGKRH